MTAKKENKESKAGKTYLKEVPDNMWNDLIRKGIYKLYPGKEIEIKGFILKNETKQLIKIYSGKPVPANCTVNKK